MAYKGDSDFIVYYSNTSPTVMLANLQRLRLREKKRDFFFFLHFFNQFTKDLEKSGTSDKGKAQYDYISFPDY